jgi:hypothetical protein
MQSNGELKEERISYLFGLLASISIEDSSTRIENPLEVIGLRCSRIEIHPYQDGHTSIHTD